MKIKLHKDRKFAFVEMFSEENRCWSNLFTWGWGLLVGWLVWFLFLFSVFVVVSYSCFLLVAREVYFQFIPLYLSVCDLDPELKFWECMTMMDSRLHTAEL